MTTVKVNGQAYEVHDGESVLSALIRNGLSPRHSCRQGTCMTCISQLIAGRVPQRSQSVLLKAQKERNLFLACVCFPKEDIEIRIQKPKKPVSG